jgi:hypothetical protein
MRISQREALRLRRRVEALESMLLSQRRAYSQEWPGGVDICRFDFSNSTAAIPEIVRTARKLGHAVVAVGDETDTVRFIALRHPEQGI